MQFENAKIDGVRVNFKKYGLYYDPNYGPNWWEYYFEPICLNKVGEEAIVDMLLLSKCNVLVRCRSNLSLWSGYFNPWMPVIDLNKHFGEK